MTRTATCLQFDGSVLAERLRGEGQVVCVREGAKVKVIFGVDARRHVDVELEGLQELTLQLIPGRA